MSELHRSNQCTPREMKTKTLMPVFAIRGIPLVYAACRESIPAVVHYFYKNSNTQPP